ncbi:MAG: hypothetical protein ACREID_08875 [Planctomycetota bacterium]
MRRIRTTSRLFALAATALLLAASAPQAAADRPEFSVLEETFEDPLLTDACGVPIEVHLRAEFITHSNGNDVTRVTVTYTNLETGDQVVSELSGLTSDSIDLEAGVAIFTASRATRIVDRGAGAVFVLAGRTEETFVFDPETGELLFHDLVFHGRGADIDLVGVLCDLLTS